MVGGVAETSVPVPGVVDGERFEASEGGGEVFRADADEGGAEVFQDVDGDGPTGGEGEYD